MIFSLYHLITVYIHIVYIYNIYTVAISVNRVFSVYIYYIHLSPLQTEGDASKELVDYLEKHLVK